LVAASNNGVYPLGDAAIEIAFFKSWSDDEIDNATR